MQEEHISIIIGKNIRTRRMFKGYSQSVLAGGIGVTFQQIQKYEKGANAISVCRLYEIANFMGVPVTALLEGVDGDDDQPFSRKVSGVSDRESLEVMKAFLRIRPHTIRKRLADLTRAIADHQLLPDGL